MYVYVYMYLQILYTRRALLLSRESGEQNTTPGFQALLVVPAQNIFATFFFLKDIFATLIIQIKFLTSIIRHVITNKIIVLLK